MPKIAQFNGKGKNPVTNFRNTPTKKIIGPGGLLLSRDDQHLELKIPRRSVILRLLSMLNFTDLVTNSGF